MNRMAMDSNEGFNDNAWTWLLNESLATSSGRLNMSYMNINIPSNDTYSQCQMFNLNCLTVNIKSC